MRQKHTHGKRYTGRHTNRDIVRVTQRHTMRDTHNERDTHAESWPCTLRETDTQTRTLKKTHTRERHSL